MYGAAILVFWPFVCDRLHEQSKVTRCSTLTITLRSTLCVMGVILAWNFSINR
jgi:hypothetical protein